MTIDPTLYEESYASFLTEAQDILQRIEQDLLSLKDDRTPAKVHSLMRSAHTLKGAAASVELDSIKQVAHVLEDIFKALYNPDIVLDTEVEALLFQGYECLRLLLVTEITGGQIDEHEVLNRAAAVIAQLQEKLGDEFDRDAALPNSTEFGVDVVQSLFEVGVEQRLTELRHTLNQDNRQSNLENIATLLRTQAEVFLGLAEFSNLPGFASIAQATLSALDTHPDDILHIAQLALHDFTQAQANVLAGDRNQGGMPSLALQELARVTHTTEFSDLIETNSNSHSIHSGESSKEDVDVDLSLDQLFGWIDLSEGELTPDLEENDTASTIIDAEQATSIQVQLDNSLNDEWFTHLITQSVANSTAPLGESSAQLSTEPIDRSRLEPVRIDAEQIRHLDYLVGELLINQGQQTTQDQQIRLTLQEWRSILQKHLRTIYDLQDYVEQMFNQPQTGKTSVAQPSVFPIAASPKLPSTYPSHHFDALELDNYHDLQQIVQSSLNEVVKLDSIAEDIDQLSKQARGNRNKHKRLLTQVRDDLSALRMQPLQDLVNRFPRLLQQLATAHGKQVELVLTGTQVLVDKTIAAKLYDPLLHLIRNAFDHGIEPPEQRCNQGKPEVGRIEIRAMQQGTQTVIEVSDDGRGIDLQRIAQRAIELDILTPEQISEMPESQLLDILFEPGFSTATQLSDLSGRGIGLDVVNNQIQAMNGSVAISSVPQQGTTFSLKIPLSLTTTKLLICQADGFIYALPIERVEQIIVPQPDQLQTSVGQQLVMRWRHGQEESVVPVYSLSELTRYSTICSHISSARSTDGSVSSTWSRTQKNSQNPIILLLQTIYGYRGLKLDQVLGEQELVVRTLGKTIASPPYVYGCCILGNSLPALAIDIEVLMQLTTEVESLPKYASSIEPRLRSSLPSPAFSLESSKQSFVGHLPAAQPPLLQRKITKTILVIDDSLTLRQSVTRLLQRTGYQAIQAEDGLKALVQLQQHPHIQAIVCDLEMPHLNGFEFLSQFRQYTTGHIPVIVLTSRMSAKHRQIAFELGAAAYLTKPFDAHALLATIDRCLQQPANL